MRNRMYGGVRGRKTKVGEKLHRFPPTRLLCDLFFYFSKGFCYTPLGVAISFLVSSVHVVPLQVDSC